jgi:excisionase family DNA binding protein
VLTVKRAAERLGVSPSLIYCLVAARKLRHERIGLNRGVIRIPEDALAEYCQQREVGVVAETSNAPPRRVNLKHLRLH